MNSFINIWQLQTKNYVNGPGCRFVIWVQGCHLGCKKCWNKHTWSFKKRNEISIDSLFTQIADIDGINGVTFTGGEPFSQAKNLLSLAIRIKKELKLNLQIFTGFELDELNNFYQKKLLALTDILVAGRFDLTKPNNNQKVYEFSDLHWSFNNSDIEIEIDEQSDVTITGYPSNEFIKNVKEAITK